MRRFVGQSSVGGVTDLFFFLIRDWEGICVIMLTVCSTRIYGF